MLGLGKTYILSWEHLLFIKLLSPMPPRMKKLWSWSVNSKNSKIVHLAPAFLPLIC